MAILRMAMRVGPRGEDMWPQCRDAGVASVTYEGIFDTDLSKFSPASKPSNWNLKGSAPGSMMAFAWRIRGGDEIYVRDSKQGGKMIAHGFVRSPLNELAYRFDPTSSIKEPKSGNVWHHLIDVDWDDSFIPFEYKDKSPNTAVLRLYDNEVDSFIADDTNRQHKKSGLSSVESRQASILEDAYPRATPAAIRLIQRLHVKLSKSFMSWLMKKYGIEVEREKSGIDMKFTTGTVKNLVEFKIAYHGHTRSAIREALGQMLEYNHYSDRQLHDLWLLILNCEPCSEDVGFIDSLREMYALPIVLGWQLKDDFMFYPSWPNNP